MKAWILAAGFVAGPAAAEVFVDVGMHSAEVEARIPGLDDPLESSGSGLHLGFGARRDVGARGSVGVRIELDDVNSDWLIAVRAFDYAHRLTDRFAVTAFVGAARLDRAIPAYGYYGGGGVRFEDLMPSWDVALEFRYGDKLARDNLLPSDPPEARGLANFYDVTGLSLYLSYRF